MYELRVYVGGRTGFVCLRPPFTGSGLCKMDIVNRAIAVYEFLDASLRVSHDPIGQDSRTEIPSLSDSCDV